MRDQTHELIVADISKEQKAFSGLGISKIDDILLEMSHRERIDVILSSLSTG